MNRWLRTPPKSVRDARLLVTAAFRAAVCWWKFGRKAELPWRRGIPAVALVALALFILPGAALAHERRTIANGKYDVVVGLDIEPTYANLKNAASIRIMQAGAGTPVTGAEKTLKLAIRQVANTKDFPLRAAFGQDGYYLADIVPDTGWRLPVDLHRIHQWRSGKRNVRHRRRQV